MRSSMKEVEEDHLECSVISSVRNLWGQTDGDTRIYTWPVSGLYIAARQICFTAEHVARNASRVSAQSH